MKRLAKWSDMLRRDATMRWSAGVGPGSAPAPTRLTNADPIGQKRPAQRASPMP